MPSACPDVRYRTSYLIRPRRSMPPVKGRPRRSQKPAADWREQQA